MWKAERERHWDLTGELKSNRRIRLEDNQGIVTWPTISEYAATLEAEDTQTILWSNQTGGQTVTQAAWLVPNLKAEIDSMPTTAPNIPHWIW